MIKLVLTKSIVTEFFLKVIAIAAGISLFFYSWSSVDAITIILTMTSMISILCINRKWSKKALLLLAINAFSVMMTLTAHSGLGSGLIHINAILACITFNRITISAKTYRQIHLIFVVLITTYILTIDFSTVKSTWLQDLCGNTINTNMVGLLALAAGLHMLSFIYDLEIKKFWKRLAYLSIVFFYGFYVVLTNCRTAILALSFFVILSCTCKKTLTYKKFRLLVTILLLLSLLFPIVYVYISNILPNFVVLGKTIFSGRNKLWRAAFGFIMEYPILGSGNDLSISGQMSMHNTLVGLWKMFGIIPVISFISSFAKCTEFQRNYNRISQLAVLSSLLCCFTESFYTNSYLYMPFLFFLLSDRRGERNDT